MRANLGIRSVTSQAPKTWSENSQHVLPLFYLSPLENVAVARVTAAQSVPAGSPRVTKNISFGIIPNRKSTRTATYKRPTPRHAYTKLISSLQRTKRIKGPKYSVDNKDAAVAETVNTTEAVVTEAASVQKPWRAQPTRSRRARSKKGGGYNSETVLEGAWCSATRSSSGSHNGSETHEL
eukprot:350051-Chlamydomonas_euryale.AAC.7